MPQQYGIEIFANWQTLVLALGVFMTTYVLRLVIQTAWRDWRENRIYNELVLHLMPIAIALFVALFAKKFPWPNVALSDSLSARIFYSCFVGMSCGLFYGRIRAAIAAFTPMPLPVTPSDTDTPVVAPAKEEDVVPEPPKGDQ